MATNDSSQSSRFEGRLFLEHGRLYFVIDVDNKTDTARISCRVDGEQQVIQMPVSEVAMRLSTSSKLDSLNTSDTTKRIVEQSDGWYFSTREGLKGPFGTEAKAKEGLDKHILASQAGAPASDAKRPEGATCH